MLCLDRIDPEGVNMPFVRAVVVVLLLVGSLLAQCGDTWLGGGVWDAAPSVFVSLPNGDLVAGGGFLTVDGVPCQHVARRVGSTWGPMGTGISNAVTSLAVLPNGDVLAAQGTSTILRWDGAAWVPHASPFATVYGYGAAQQVAVTTAGELHAVGYSLGLGLPPTVIYSVSRWDGASWQIVEDSFWTNARFGPLLPHSSGAMYYVAHYGTPPFVLPPEWVVRLVGGQWHVVGQMDATVRQLLEAPDGDVVALGDFQQVQAGSAVVSAGGAAVWNGSSWSALGPPVPAPVVAATALPDGDLAIAGRVSATQTDLVRWDGSAWTSFGTADADVGTMHFDAAGAVWVSGAFSGVGGVSAPLVARHATSCPATTASFAAGCASSVGNAQWSVTARPWVGGTYRTTCSNLPPMSFAIDVIGLATQSLALDAVFVEGVPGCTVVPTLDGLALQTVSFGSVTREVEVPDLPIAGLQFYHQVVPFELDAGGVVIAVTATDTLQLTIGSY